MSSAWGRGCVGLLLSVLHTWIQQNIPFLPETHRLAPPSLWLRQAGPGFRWDHACKVCPPTKSGHPAESLLPSVLSPLIIAHWGDSSHHLYVRGAIWRCTSAVRQRFDWSAAPQVLLRLSLEAEFHFLRKTFISQDSSVDGGWFPWLKVNQL